MIPSKVYYNLGLIVVIAVVYFYIPILHTACVFLLGISTWNIYEGLQIKPKNPKIQMTPYNKRSAESVTSSKWSDSLPPLTPISPLQKQSTPTPLSHTNTPLNKIFEKAKHSTSNTIQKYPVTIKEDQVHLMKSWIVNKILRPFVKDLKLVNLVYPIDSMIEHPNKSIPFVPIDDPLIECQELPQLHLDNKWALKRFTYEMFLQVPGTDQSGVARKYLINRIKELAQHSHLINYCTDSKSILHFQPTFATDGQIVLHFVDVFLKINAPYHSQSILQFICCMNRLPDEYHFNSNRTLYKLDEKDSLMKALVAFVLYIEEECGGYFGLLNLHTPMVNVPHLKSKIEVGEIEQ
eukprot:NODE_82_length_22708_cov_0.383476.p4 type:complete len:350 gc:universal NODE_82_length_22708_cov_0.383476:1823-2872(+)